MKDMQLLTEKDLEYFKKKAEEGSAMILELSEEQLLRLDFSRWVEREPNTIKESEVIEWLEEARDEIQKPYDDVQYTEKDTCSKPDDGMKKYKTLAEWLQNHELSDEEYEVIRQVMQNGFTEEQLLVLLSAGKGLFFD